MLDRRTFLASLAAPLFAPLAGTSHASPIEPTVAAADVQRESVVIAVPLPEGRWWRDTELDAWVKCATPCLIAGSSGTLFRTWWSLKVGPGCLWGQVRYERRSDLPDATPAGPGSSPRGTAAPPTLRSLLPH